jgi:energy-coupling factor transporter ATP-binding protein EcfA2
MMKKTPTDPSPASISGETIAIDIDGLNKWFDEFHVLKDIALKVAEKEIIVICGPSGSGKSTLIRCINQLEAYQEGRISIFGRDLGFDKQKRCFHPAACRNAVSEFQPVSTPDHTEELHTGPYMAAKDTRTRSHRAIHGLIGKGGRRPPGIEIPRSDIGRPTAARRHCPLPGHGTPDYAVRRAHVGIGPGNDQGGPWT